MSQRGHIRRMGRVYWLRLRRVLEPGGPCKRISIRLGDITDLPNRTAARAAADRWIAANLPEQLHAGKPVEWSTEWCDRYVNCYLAMQSQGTRRSQTSIVNRHLRHAFPGPVHGVTPARVQEWLFEMQAAGVAAATLDSWFRVLRRMLRVAKAEGVAALPPTAGAMLLPKQATVAAPPRQKAFTLNEVSRILEAAVDPYRTAFALATFAGLRTGEVLGLQWHLVDLVRGSIEVRQQAVDRSLVVLKTRGSRATLPTATPLLAFLRAYRETWQPNEAGLLFAHADGRAWTGAELRAALHELLERLGIPRKGMHAFRHACALAMADASVNPETMRRALRHSSLQVTALYLSATPEDIAAALARGAEFRDART